MWLASLVEKGNSEQKKGSSSSTAKKIYSISIEELP
jgi:hypothetical protein